MMKVLVDYPNRDQELRILERMSMTRQTIEVTATTTPEEIMSARELVDQIFVDQRVKEYVVDLVMATRQPQAYNLPLAELIQFGASPRATINLTLAAKANAFFDGRAFVVPEDVKSVAMDVLRHRVIITYEAEAEETSADDLVDQILRTVPVP